jgi:hypothetical protein
MGFIGERDLPLFVSGSEICVICYVIGTGS